MNASALKGPMGYAVLIGVAGVVVYLLWDKLAGAAQAAADTAGGVLSGNNAVTTGTPYEGAGVAGTAGAAANVVTGGVLQSIGEWLGGVVADATDTYDPNAPALQTRKMAIGDNFFDRGILQ